MTLLEAYRASEALEPLMKNEELTAREAYCVMKLSRSVRDEAQFYAQKRNTLLERYGKQDEADHSKYHFTTREDMEAYSASVRELDGTEASVHPESVRLRGDIRGITPDMLDALAGLVTID